MLCGYWKSWYIAFQHLNVMYDIACTLVQHLRSSKNGAYLLDRVRFSLPSFHAFGHNAACQVKNNE